ncbi:MAG: 30S ribosomal protein S16, partial [Alphaproteobacteria bacterium]
LPKDHAERMKLESERIKHWMSVGALPTDRVARMLGDAGLMAKPARGNNPEQGKPKAKALERIAQKAEAASKAAAAAAAPAEEAAPAEA